MNQYVFRPGACSGSDHLQFRKKDARAGEEPPRQDALYVLDMAFFFFLESIFKEVIATFDMFEDTCITRKQWQSIARLNIPEIVPPEFVHEARETVSSIDHWVQEEIGEDEEFIVIGV